MEPVPAPGVVSGLALGDAGAALTLGAVDSAFAPGAAASLPMAGDELAVGAVLSVAACGAELVIAGEEEIEGAGGSLEAVDAASPDDAVEAGSRAGAFADVGADLLFAAGFETFEDFAGLLGSISGSVAASFDEEDDEAAGVGAGTASERLAVSATDVDGAEVAAAEVASAAVDGDAAGAVAALATVVGAAMTFASM